MTVVWSERALEQLVHAIETIAKDNPIAAWRIYDRINAAADLLTRFPLIGKGGRVSNTRELIIIGTTYIAVYRIVGERIEIAAIWHWSQSRNRP